MNPKRRHRRTRKAFISYSRAGGQAYAVSLYQGLVQVLGEEAVFLDVGRDAMEAGRSWKASVREALAGCDTLLLVLDPGMVTRLAEPENAVLFELETALEYEKTIACIRVNGATVPPASSLPPSLGDLSEWHSPEVHSDAAVADIERVIKELTGRIPGQVPAVDGWDLGVLGALAALGVAAWFSVGRSLLNLHESWLWGAALFIPWLIWMGGRRALSIGKRGRASLRYRQAAGWLAVLIVFGSGLFFAGRAIYRVPEFPAKSGILVSRLDGDPRDWQQRKLAMSLQWNEDVSSDAEFPKNVAMLPRRIGFSSPFTLTLSNGHEVAREYGRRTRAAVVLWGRQLGLAETKLRVAVNLTFIESEALFKKFGSKLVGAIEASELNGLDSDLERLAETLPRFLNGYRRYHDAENESDFAWLEVEFLSIIEDLRANPTEDPRDRDAVDELLASLHFYRGNTLLILGRREEAVSEYEAAVSQTAEVVGGVEYPRYIEAASNLGWLLKEKGDLDETVAILTSVDRKCEGGDRRQRACAYAWYNLGDALSDQGQHERASGNFKRAIERIQENAQNTADRRLNAYSHQYLAFSLVRRAAASGVSGRVSLLEKAHEAWMGGVDALKRAGLKVPAYFQITLGRIHLERRKWELAIEVLTNSDAPPDREAIVHALLAGAYSCVKDVDQAQKHLSALVGSGVMGSSSDGFRITVQEGMTEIRRIKMMCAEVSQTGS